MPSGRAGDAIATNSEACWPAAEPDVQPNAMSMLITLSEQRINGCPKAAGQPDGNALFPLLTRRNPPVAGGMFYLHGQKGTASEGIGGKVGNVKKKTELSILFVVSEGYSEHVRKKSGGNAFQTPELSLPRQSRREAGLFTDSGKNTGKSIRMYDNEWTGTKPIFTFRQ